MSPFNFLFAVQNSPNVYDIVFRPWFCSQRISLLLAARYVVYIFSFGGQQQVRGGIATCLNFLRVFNFAIIIVFFLRAPELPMKGYLYVVSDYFKCLAVFSTRF